MIELLKKHPFFKHQNIESLSLLQDQGYCNENYLLQTNESKYIVRKLIRDDIDRAFEWHVLGLTYACDITAEPLAYDEVNGIMVFGFLEGLHKNDLNQEEIILLAHTLKRLHEIDMDAQPIQIEINQTTQEVLHELDIIAEHPKDYVLCHNDLNPKNIFFSHGVVKFIDFEYAGVNDRYFDLACICVEFDLKENSEKNFLDTYFQTSYDMTKLNAYKVIYRAFCKEWFENML